MRGKGWVGVGLRAGVGWGSAGVGPGAGRVGLVGTGVACGMARSVWLHTAPSVPGPWVRGTAGPAQPCRPGSSWHLEALHARPAAASRAAPRARPPRRRPPHLGPLNHERPVGCAHDGAPAAVPRMVLSGTSGRGRVEPVVAQAAARRGRRLTAAGAPQMRRAAATAARQTQAPRLLPLQRRPLRQGTRPCTRAPGARAGALRCSPKPLLLAAPTLLLAGRCRRPAAVAGRSPSERPESCRGSCGAVVLGVRRVCN